MEGAKNIIVCILLCVYAGQVKSSYKSAIYHSYIYDDMVQWRRVIDIMNTEKNKSDEFLLELLNYQYGFIAWCLGNGDDQLAGDYLYLAENILQQLEKKSFNPSLVYSYKSALLGYRIGLNRLRAPFLGPRSVKFAKMAMEIDPKNPFGYIQYGNSLYHRPTVFGGSKEEALQYFLKAEMLMESDREKIREDWNYLNLLTYIALAYAATDRFTQAKVYYDKILDIEPNHLWVKNELLPDLLNKMR
jgi:tetratricopeptide (TPR) repeat protein